MSVRTFPEAIVRLDAGRRSSTARLPGQADPPRLRRRVRGVVRRADEAEGRRDEESGRCRAGSSAASRHAPAHRGEQVDAQRPFDVFVAGVSQRVTLRIPNSTGAIELAVRHQRRADKLVGPPPQQRIDSPPGHRPSRRAEFLRQLLQFRRRARRQHRLEAGVRQRAAEAAPIPARARHERDPLVNQALSALGAATRPPVQVEDVDAMRRDSALDFAVGSSGSAARSESGAAPRNRGAIPRSAAAAPPRQRPRPAQGSPGP